MTNDDATATILGIFRLTVVADATSGWTRMQVPDSATRWDFDSR